VTHTPALRPFRPNLPDAAGVVSWVHIGDLHMTSAEGQNYHDLLAIVDEINAALARSISFVFLPGDVADHGSAAEYEIVRSALDRLTAPWCSIVGDHDVHEKSFENFLQFMAQKTTYSFQVGTVHFFAMNAFDVPDPGSFALLPPQLDWLARHLAEMGDGGTAVLLLHCYPTDLKQGGERLRSLVASPAVRLIDMGHTHYNEVANNGHTIYTTTRSTGQIEEGPVGFSVTTIDGPIVSWRFFPLGRLPAVMITSPADERFITEETVDDLALTEAVRVRAKVWSKGQIRSVSAKLGAHSLALQNIPASAVWEGAFDKGLLPEGIHTLSAEATDDTGQVAQDEIRFVYGRSAYQAPQRKERDQDNAVDAWPERGLLGTQLGPNKSGREW
jgi:Icc protein